MWCCRVPGNSCYRTGQGLGGGLNDAKSYIDSHGLRDFFLTQDWRALLGDIPQRIVDTIIANNPKHVFLDDNGIVVLRDSTGGIESSNVVAAFLTRESRECDEVFGNQ